MNLKNQNTPILVGLDDGHDHMKIYLGKNKVTGEPMQFKMHSRAVFGCENIGDDDKVNHERIVIGNDTYTVSESLTNFANTRNDNYPTSPLSKVLVYQALRLALAQFNIDARNLNITSGLPVNKFYDSATRLKNQTLISAKKENLLAMSDVFNILDQQQNKPQIKIIDHTVLCEASAAYYDFILDDDGKETDQSAELGLYQAGAAVLDIGGRTTDCIVLNPQGHNINANRSGTIDVGILEMYDQIRNTLKQREGWSYINESALSEAIITGVYRLGKNSYDITEIIKTAKYSIFKRIEEFIFSTIGDGSDLPAIILAGGGSYSLRDLITAKYKNTVIPEHPEFANARGFYKVLNFYV